MDTLSPATGTTPPIQEVVALQRLEVPEVFSTAVMVVPGCAKTVFGIATRKVNVPQTRIAAEKTLLRNGAQQLSRVFIKYDMSNDG
jgi:hypothetical protein